MTKTRTCPQCEREFTPNASHQIYESQECRQQAWVEKEVKAAQADAQRVEQQGTNRDWQDVAETAILNLFAAHRHDPDWNFHSDDLWHLIPDDHRGVISLAVMALVNKKLMVGCGYRKSVIPSRKRSPSQEYRLTELGRDRIAGVGADGTARPSRKARGAGDNPLVSTDSGDDGSSEGASLGASPPASEEAAAQLFGEESAAARHMRDDLAA